MSAWVAGLAGACAVLTGLGFGIPALLGARYVARTGEVWTLWGFPTYGGGPFEDLGLYTTAPLLVGFLAVCIAEVVVGVLLIAGSRSALWLSLIIFPFEAAYWFGFALPFGWVFGVVRVALTILAMRRWEDGRASARVQL